MHSRPPHAPAARLCSHCDYDVLRLRRITCLSVLDHAQAEQSEANEAAANLAAAEMRKPAVRADLASKFVNQNPQTLAYQSGFL